MDDLAVMKMWLNDPAFLYGDQTGLLTRGQAPETLSIRDTFWFLMYV